MHRYGRKNCRTYIFRITTFDSHPNSKNIRRRIVPPSITFKNIQRRFNRANRIGSTIGWYSWITNWLSLNRDPYPHVFVEYIIKHKNQTRLPTTSITDVSRMWSRVSIDARYVRLPFNQTIINLSDKATFKTHHALAIYRTLKLIDQLRCFAWIHIEAKCIWQIFVWQILYSFFFFSWNIFSKLRHVTGTSNAC